MSIVPVSWLSIGERMHLHGPERLKVVGVVMVEREKESYSGYMN
jgi:hypothetical protein